MLPLLIAFGALAVIAAGASSSSDERRVWVPPIPLDQEPQKLAPTCKLLDTRMPEPRGSDPAAWLAYFASGGCNDAPPEMASSDADVAATGDLDELPRDGALGARAVYNALFLEDDPGELLMLADQVDGAGYLFAANRLRKKAFRLIT